MNIIQQGMAVIAFIGAVSGGVIGIESRYAHEQDFVAFTNEYKLERVNNQIRDLKKELRGIKRKERAEGLDNDEQEEKDILKEELEELQEEKESLKDGKG